MITYKKAQVLFNGAKSKRIGRPLGQGVYLLKVKNNFVAMLDHEPLFSINKKNEYIIGVVEPRKAFVGLLNRFTPSKVRLINKKLFFGNMPYYLGLKLNAEGDIIIPQAWSYKINDLSCELCYSRYSIEKCNICTQEQHDKLVRDANNIEDDGTDTPEVADYAPHRMED